jgi:hypothetical protein
MQAGTAATMTGNSVSYWAWTEWFPAGYKVSNLAVNAGDLVSVLVCAWATTNGYVAIFNQTTNQAISAGLINVAGLQV